MSASDSFGRYSPIIKDLDRRTGLRETSFSYYDNGDLQIITDPEGNVTTYAQYDAMGRIKDVKRPDGTHVLFDYDKNGNMTTLTTPAGRSQVFS
jgi:YD repeat-containing protein